MASGSGSCESIKPALPSSDFQHHVHDLLNQWSFLSHLCELGLRWVFIECIREGNYIGPANSGEEISFSAPAAPPLSVESYSTVILENCDPFYDMTSCCSFLDQLPHSFTRRLSGDKGPARLLRPGRGLSSLQAKTGYLFSQARLNTKSWEVGRSCENQ